MAVRVTPEDRRLLEAAARTAQLSLSDLIRRALDAAATATLEAVRADR
ncbi:MAG: DUF1778 domain-containing protein [Gemmatimonadetes bacterium]|nr:DUF1778 domain-containing protein [Gemmatimonadota bacterium]